jgi:hypothetical protein
MTRNDQATELLQWIVEFMNEHPEWTAEHFTEHGNALSETIWLESANQFFGYK